MTSSVTFVGVRRGIAAISFVSFALSAASSLSCLEPPPVANSFRNLVTSNDAITDVIYTCYQGYQMTSGDAHRICNISGVYTGESPVCTGACPVPQKTNVLFNFTGVVSGAVAKAVCKSDKWPNSVQADIVCDGNSHQWNMSNIICRELFTPANAKQSSTQGNQTPELAFDEDKDSCSLTKSSTVSQWQTTLIGQQAMHYVTHVAVVSPLKYLSYIISLKFEIVGSGSVGLCATVSDLSRFDAFSRLYLECEQTNGQYPMGNQLLITGSYSQASQLALCSMLVAGTGYMNYCLMIPQIPGLRLYAASMESASSTTSSVGSSDYYVTNSTLRYVCDGDRTPLRGEDLAFCDSEGNWTQPTLICTDLTNFASQRDVWLSDGMLSSGTVIEGVTDGDDGTCTAIGTTAWLQVQVTEPLEVSMVNVVITKASCPVVISATIALRAPDSTSNKTCTLFQTEVTYNRTKVTVMCLQRPVCTGVVLVQIACTDNHQQSVEPEICEVRVFGRRFLKAFECFQSAHGEDYKGEQSTTANGYQCQPWDIRVSHPYKTPELFPDWSLKEAGAFCRNPTGSRSEPWCYVDSSYQKWDTCTIPVCDEVCLVDAVGASYAGILSQTANGVDCLAWDTPGLPHLLAEDFPDVSASHHYCRNPGNSQSSPWCYTQVSVTAVYGHCAVSLCGDLNVSSQATSSVAPTTEVTSHVTTSSVAPTTEVTSHVTTSSVAPTTEVTSHVTTLNVAPTTEVTSHVTTSSVAPTTEVTSHVTTSSVAPTTEDTSPVTTSSVAPTTEMAKVMGSTKSWNSLTSQGSPVFSSTFTLLTTGHHSEVTRDQGRHDESSLQVTVESDKDSNTEAFTYPTSQDSNFSPPNSSPSRPHHNIQCFCRKRDVDSTAASAVSLNQTLRSLQEDLTLNKQLMSGYLRTKRSIHDNRASAISIGVLGLGLLFGFALLFLAPDVVSALVFIGRSLRCRSHRCKITDSQGSSVS